nr:AraC family transcriptional regulator [Kibdelosporangium sp. MJ126-NF4]CEL19389.1 Transcriptional regulator, AraC family [Kibdelosporangium sp. MJ126-NF4]CTQ94812.1 Transcriptional regulator, AraC family [Kibdelosporangium sp. MJ126-NF4]
MEWVRYRRLADRPVEAMHAHFEQHSYHLHSHDTYSFGLTEHGAQVFGCRGSRRTSAAGMVMAFNPDEPHDGHAGNELGFTYRIIHIDPSLITDVLSDRAGRPAGLPLFAEPVLHDPVLAGALDRMYRSLSPEATTLAKDEALADTVAALVRRAALHPPTESAVPAPSVRRARGLLDEAYLDPLGADELAAVAGCSRFALYRAFKAAYGMSPSDYQRQLRLRAARRLIVAGVAPAEAASQSGFADQAHLTRWFRRYYGITPGAYQRA